MQANARMRHHTPGEGLLKAKATEKFGVYDGTSAHSAGRPGGLRLTLSDVVAPWSSAPSGHRLDVRERVLDTGHRGLFLDVEAARADVRTLTVPRRGQATVMVLLIPPAGFLTLDGSALRTLLAAGPRPAARRDRESGDSGHRSRRRG